MTINEIAKHLHTTPSTVSKAINGASDISPEKRREILEYVNSVGYSSRRKNSAKGYAAILWGKGVREDGVLAVAAEAFCAAASRQHVFVSSHSVGDEFEPEAFFAEHAYSGALVLDVDCSSLVYRKLRDAKLPLVFFNCAASGDPLISSVCGNDLMAAADAVEYLASLGHTQIAFIGGEGNSTVNAERFAGYIFGLQKNGLPYRFDLTYFGDMTEQTGQEAADFFLSRNKRITAYLCVSDRVAESFIRCVQLAGNAVPGDLSIITFCDSKTARDGPFPIASIVQDFGVMGEQAFNALRVTMQGYPAQHVTVKRETTSFEKTCAPKKRLFPTDVG